MATPARSLPLLVDCATCQVRGPACSRCVVSVLLGVPDDEPIGLAGPELDALDALAGSGLLPPLRLVRAVDPEPPSEGVDDVVS